MDHIQKEWSYRESEREGEKEREGIVGTRRKRKRGTEREREREKERERHWNSIIYEIQLLRDEMNPLIWDEQENRDVQV